MWPRLWVVSISLALVSAPSCSQVGTPSVAYCLMRWNAQGNAKSQVAVAAAGFPRATVFGWSGEGGEYCTATFFTRQGEPWANYALWLDSRLQAHSSERISPARGMGRGSWAPRNLPRRMLPSDRTGR
jgi:hypothetical protein